MKPDAFTIAEHMLDVGHDHNLYIQDWGNKNAKTPILSLHGGPGGESKDKHKLPFDPKTQRVIFHDQRGCGRSLPYGKWHHNNTQELADDITKIADYLHIDKFVLTGGSWGACLALYYAIQHPERISALVIDGIFTGSQAEIDWLDKGLLKTHFPDAWDAYLAATPKQYRDDPSAYHFAQAFGTDPEAARVSAQAYGALELAALSLDDTITPMSPDDFDQAGLLIEMRYLAKRCFLPDRYILKNAHKLTMPTYLLQGRYDMVCPPSTAYELSKLIPSASLIWIISGHKSEHETLTAKRLIYTHTAT